MTDREGLGLDWPRGVVVEPSICYTAQQLVRQLAQLVHRNPQ